LTGGDLPEMDMVVTVKPVGGLPMKIRRLDNDTAVN